jgi:arylsulfatase
VVRRQYTHITDVLPTLADLIGVPLPAGRAGQPADPLAGTSFRPSLEDPAADQGHPEQYYECVGNRAYYKDGWEAVTTHRQLTPFTEDRWQLYHTETDPTQCDDLAAAEPGRVKDLAAAWEEAAWANQVFPLYEGTRLKYYLRPPHDADFTKPVRILAGTPTLERWRSSRLIAGRSFRITVDWDWQPGDEGVLVAHGEQGAGYLLYVEDGQLHLFVNEYGTPRPLAAVPLPEASSQVTADFHAPGGGIWNIRLDLDGRQVAAASGVRQFAGFLPYGGIDVGIDRRSPVCWELHQRRGPFPFTGQLHAVTYQPGQLAPDAGDRLIEEARAIGLALE